MVWGAHAAPVEGRDPPAAMVFTSRATLILSGLLLMYVFSSQIQLFPLTGAYGPERRARLDLGFRGFGSCTTAFLPLRVHRAGDVRVLGAGECGGLMITVQGEDYYDARQGQGAAPRATSFTDTLIPQRDPAQITAFALKDRDAPRRKGTGSSWSAIFRLQRHGQAPLTTRSSIRISRSIQGVSFVIILMTAACGFPRRPDLSADRPAHPATRGGRGMTEGAGAANAQRPPRPTPPAMSASSSVG